MADLNRLEELLNQNGHNNTDQIEVVALILSGIVKELKRGKKFHGSSRDDNKIMISYHAMLDSISKQLKETGLSETSFVMGSLAHACDRMWC